jgi:hypothetical protein
MLNDFYEDLLENMEEGNTADEMELEEDGIESNTDKDEMSRNYSDAESSIDESDLIMVQEPEDEEEQLDDDYVIETEQIITDEAQSSFEGFGGQYGPYFSDYTSMMLFTWISKHQICMLMLYCIIVISQIN